MGRRAAGEASAYSRSVSEAVQSVQRRVGLSNTDLIQATGMSPSYYYVRMRGDLAFTIDDLVKFAAALKTDPHEFTRIASESVAAEVDGGPTVELPTAELARRLQLLAGSPLNDGAAFDLPRLRAHLRERATDAPAGMWDDLVRGDGDGVVSLRLLTAMADFFSVDGRYLTDFDVSEVTELAEAQLDFRRALRETGADSVTGRALGEVSAGALRAITRSIRSIDAHET